MYKCIHILININGFLCCITLITQHSIEKNDDLAYSSSTAASSDEVCHSQVVARSPPVLIISRQLGLGWGDSGQQETCLYKCTACLCTNDCHFCVVTAELHLSDFI